MYTPSPVGNSTVNIYPNNTQRYRDNVTYWLSQRDNVIYTLRYLYNVRDDYQPSNHMSTGVSHVIGNQYKTQV